MPSIKVKRSAVISFVLAMAAFNLWPFFDRQALFFTRVDALALFFLMLAFAIQNNNWWFSYVLLSGGINRVLDAWFFEPFGKDWASATEYMEYILITIAIISYYLHNKWKSKKPQDP